MKNVKKDFPIFSNHPELVYLDSNATSQKPQIVLDKLNEVYENYNANVHRGVYEISENATLGYDGLRKKVKDFIGAQYEEEIVYTKGTTESINLVMRSWGEENIKQGDKIVITVMEHHANFVPWQQLAKKKKAIFEVIDINNDGTLKEEEFDKIQGAKIVAVSHCSNVLGTINDVKKICKIAKKEGVVSLVDAAQSVPHFPVNVREIDCDFLAFSGHKMFAPFGTGILFGRKELLEKMPPFMFGGDMIKSVTINETKFNTVPYKFEPGTPIVAEMIAFGTAIDYLKKVGMENIRKHEVELIKYAFEKLEGIVDIVGPREINKKSGAISFNVDKVHAHDVAAMLNEYKIAVRSGHHCCMPLHVRLNLPATCRASFYLYNAKEEIDKLAEALNKIKKLFK